MTSGYPWWLPWRHVPRCCPCCRQRVTFAVWTRLTGGRSAYSALCLACGRATSEYLWPRERDARGARLRRRVEPAVRGGGAAASGRLLAAARLLASSGYHRVGCGINFGDTSPCSRWVGALAAVFVVVEACVGLAD
jgi:hypothetical protein